MNICIDFSVKTGFAKDLGLSIKEETNVLLQLNNVLTGQMRSLRLFFNDSACTCGQLVVASRESQYKILHFHHGGLDRLATVLQDWNFLLHSPQLSAADQSQLPYRHFMVCRCAYPTSEGNYLQNCCLLHVANRKLQLCFVIRSDSLTLE